MFTKGEIVILFGLDPLIGDRKWNLNQDLVLTKWVYPTITKELYNELVLAKEAEIITPGTITPVQQEGIDIIGYVIGWYIQACMVSNDMYVGASGTAVRTFIDNDEWTKTNNDQRGSQGNSYLSQFLNNGDMYLIELREWYRKNYLDNCQDIDNLDTFSMMLPSKEDRLKNKRW